MSMPQPGFIGLCRDILLSFMPFIGGFACVSMPLLPFRSMDPKISVSNASLCKGGQQRILPDYRPVRLFGKVVAINFGKGY